MNDRYRFIKLHITEYFILDFKYGSGSFSSFSLYIRYLKNSIKIDDIKFLDKINPLIEELQYVYYFDKVFIIKLIILVIHSSFMLDNYKNICIIKDTFGKFLL